MKGRPGALFGLQGQCSLGSVDVPLVDDRDGKGWRERSRFQDLAVLVGPSAGGGDAAAIVPRLDALPRLGVPCGAPSSLPHISSRLLGSGCEGEKRAGGRASRPDAGRGPGPPNSALEPLRSPTRRLAKQAFSQGCGYRCQLEKAASNVFFEAPAPPATISSAIRVNLIVRE